MGNAAALDVAKLLQTEVNGDSLIASLNRGDCTALEVLAGDKPLSDAWIAGFKQVLVDKQPASHKLAKQIYMPIAAHQYHLISPLFASSLTHALHQRIVETRFSEQAKEARAAMKANTWSDKPAIVFPSTAVLNFGGTKPQNVSYLNSVRGGKCWLLSSAPPEWRTVCQPPLNNQSIFSHSEFTRQAWPVIKRLKLYLQSVNAQASKLAIRQRRLSFIDEIIDILFNYVSGVQNLTEYSGWSAKTECRLKRSQQLWLDPRRAEADLAFRQERNNDDWRQELANDFGFWFNYQLGSDLLKVGDTERRYFSTVPLFKQRLRELENDLSEDLP